MNDLETKPEELETKAERITNHLADYAETFLKLGAVNATEKATVVATVALTASILTFFFLFALLFVGLGIAIWLGNSWGNPTAGYFAVAGFYVLCTLVFFALRKRFIFPVVRDHIIRKVYE